MTLTKRTLYFVKPVDGPNIEVMLEEYADEFGEIFRRITREVRRNVSFPQENIPAQSRADEVNQLERAIYGENRNRS
jgi:hypothetical protein